MLGLLLERINIPYHIFERATEPRPLGMRLYGAYEAFTIATLDFLTLNHSFIDLGSVMTLGPTILPAFEQLGLLEEIEKMSLLCNSLDMYNEHMEKLGAIDLTGHKAA